MSSCKEYASISIEENGAEKTFQGLMQEAMNNSFDQIDGISMTINSHDKNLVWSGSVGHDHMERKDSLETDQPFRIASITKTFVATAILKLHEMDSLSIHDPISKYISKKHIDILSKDEYDFV